MGQECSGGALVRIELGGSIWTSGSGVLEGGLTPRESPTAWPSMAEELEAWRAGVRGFCRPPRPSKDDQLKLLPLPFGRLDD